MKYMLMFVGDEVAWDRVDPEVKKRGYEAVGQWWEEHSKAGRIVSGQQLKPRETATTVRRRDGKITVTDGPFMEAKESLGGFAIVDVADLDAAIALAKTWPGLETLEIRPLVEARDTSGQPADSRP
jgi:hypothetical protein